MISKLSLSKEWNNNIIHSIKEIIVVIEVVDLEVEAAEVAIKVEVTIKVEEAITTEEEEDIVIIDAKEEEEAITTEVEEVTPRLKMIEL